MRRSMCREGIAKGEESRHEAVLETNVIAAHRPAHVVWLPEVTMRQGAPHQRIVETALD